MKPPPTHHTPQTCHWSVPTLLMPRPYWLSASESSWCCWNDRQIIVLDSTEICETCQVWKSRKGDSTHVGAVPQPGAMPFREP